MAAQAKPVKDIREDDPVPELHFPAAFADDRPVDPLTIHIEPMGEGYEEFPVWSISLVDVVEQHLEIVRQDGSYSEELREIASALEKLAKQIRDACVEGENNYAKVSAE